MSNFHTVRKAASDKIPTPRYTDVLVKADGRIPNIIDDIELALREGVSQQLTEFSKDFPPTRAGMQKLWTWMKRYITYNEDGEAAQIIQEPARLNQTRRGDCKSFSLFIASVILCHKKPVSLMYVHYPDTYSNHVYPIAHFREGEVIVDAVWKRFDEQKEPFELIKEQLFKI
ncbi:MAG: hypothetical protein U5L45_15850 [Saprospiraceae bacterium]|nr:hypothetical protein [Saprospiraceae bacterium]